MTANSSKPSFADQVCGGPVVPGKYRGTVINNVDPLGESRILVTVPDVSLTPAWATPAHQVAGIQMGSVSVPPIGSGVWIEYEHGDPDRPVWAGSWFGSAAEPPSLTRQVPPGVGAVVIQTTTQNGLLITDAPGPQGGLRLQSRSLAFISITEEGIRLQNGSASILITPTSVVINNGALTIT